ALYQLGYNASKALLFASHGDKLVVLSNPAKLYDPQSGATEEPGSVSTTAVAALLNGEKLFPEAFGLPPRAPQVKQRLSVMPVCWPWVTSVSFRTSPAC